MRCDTIPIAKQVSSSFVIQSYRHMLLLYDTCQMCASNFTISQGECAYGREICIDCNNFYGVPLKALVVHLWPVLMISYGEEIRHCDQHNHKNCVTISRKNSRHRRFLLTPTDVINLEKILCGCPVLARTLHLLMLQYTLWQSR